MNDNNDTNGTVKDNPFANAILLNLTVRKLGDRRTVKEEVKDAEIEVDADKKLLNVSKKILECKEYDAVKSLVNDVRTYLAKKSLPCKFVKGGIYALPLAFVERVSDRMTAYQEEFKAKVDAFVAVYSGAVQDAVSRLKVLGNSDEYIPEDRVRKEFDLTWEYLTLGPPESLQRVSAEIWKQAKEKAAETMRAAAGDVQDALRATFAEMVSHMSDCLKPKPDGSKKKFQSGTVDKLKEFMADFSAKNIMGDGELDSLVGKARALLDGADVKALRKDDSLREATASKLDEIKAQMSALVTEGKRAIVLED